MGEPLHDKQQQIRDRAKSYLAIAGRGFHLSSENPLEDAMSQILYELCWYGIENGLNLEDIFNDALKIARENYPNTW